MENLRLDNGYLSETRQKDDFVCIGRIRKQNQNAIAEEFCKLNVKVSTHDKFLIT